MKTFEKICPFCRSEKVVEMAVPVTLENVDNCESAIKHDFYEGLEVERYE